MSDNDRVSLTDEERSRLLRFLCGCGSIGDQYCFHAEEALQDFESILAARLAADQATIAKLRTERDALFGKALEFKRRNIESIRRAEAAEADREALDVLMAKRSQHFEPGTYVIFDGERYKVWGYLNDEMVLDNEYRTITVKAYASQWRKYD